MRSFQSTRRRLMLLAALTTTLIVGMGLAGQAEAAAVSTAPLHLGSTSGLPEQSVRFSASGFRAHESVALHWSVRSGPVLAQVKASGTGAVSGSFRVPLPRAGARATVEVLAVGKSSGRVREASFGQTCTDEWTDLKGGDWSKASDWSTGAVPGSTTAACITLASKSYTVTVSQITGSTSVGRLILGAPSGKTTQTLRLLPSGSDMYFGFAKTSTVERRGAFVLSSAGGGNVFLPGPGSLDNSGAFSTVEGQGWSRYLDTPIVNEPSGTASFAAAKTGCCTYDSASFTNEGKLEVASGAEFNQSGGANVFTESGGSIANNGILSLNGVTLNKKGGKNSGQAFVLNGVTFNDSAGTGSYAIESSSTFAGNIPAGQTVNVVGDNGNNTILTLDNTVSNHGTFVMSAANINGPSNAMLASKGTGGTSKEAFRNYGTFNTVNGPGWTRYLYTNVTNEPGGHMNLAGTVQVNVTQDPSGPVTLTNDGTLNLEAGVQVQFYGPVYGQANFVQNSDGTMDVTPSSSVGTSSADPILYQPQCSGAGCQNEYINLAGTLKIASSGPSSRYLLWADNYGVNPPNNPTTSGSFAHVDGGSAAYSYSTDQQDGESVVITR